jgi:hypothetical protein
MPEGKTAHKTLQVNSSETFPGSDITTAKIQAQTYKGAEKSYTVAAYEYIAPHPTPKK